MRAEAEANADADKAAREKVDKLNGADSLIFQTEKQLKEYGEKVPADKKGAIESALEELKAAHKAEDFDAIDAASAKMQEAWSAASQDMYANTQENPNPEATANDNAGAENTGSNEGEDVEDVEFEEADDAK